MRSFAQLQPVHSGCKYVEANNHDSRISDRLSLHRHPKSVRAIER